MPKMAPRTRARSVSSAGDWDGGTKGSNPEGSAELSGGTGRVWVAMPLLEGESSAADSGSYRRGRRASSAEHTGGPRPHAATVAVGAESPA